MVTLWANLDETHRDCCYQGERVSYDRTVWPTIKVQHFPQTPNTSEDNLLKWTHTHTHNKFKWQKSICLSQVTHSALSSSVFEPKHACVRFPPSTIVPPSCEAKFRIIRIFAFSYNRGSCKINSNVSINKMCYQCVHLPVQTVQLVRMMRLTRQPC